MAGLRSIIPSPARALAATLLVGLLGAAPALAQPADGVGAQIVPPASGPAPQTPVEPAQGADPSTEVSAEPGDQGSEPTPGDPAATDPPRLVDSQPVDGGREIDAGLDRLRASFDQDLVDAGPLRLQAQGESTVTVREVEVGTRSVDYDLDGVLLAPGTRYAARFVVAGADDRESEVELAFTTAAATAQVITLVPDQLSDLDLGAGPLGLTATADSGLEVEVTSGNPDVCRVTTETAGGSTTATIELLAPGTCTITARQGGDAIWDAVEVTRSFAVLAAGPVATQATISVAPTAAAAGDTLIISGTGWLPGEAVALSIGVDVTRLGTVTADDAGVLDARVAVPQLPLGDQRISATGTDSGATASAAFTVLADSAAPPAGNGTTVDDGAAVVDDAAAVDDEGLAATGGSGLVSTTLLGVLLALLGGGLLLATNRLAAADTWAAPVGPRPRRAVPPGLPDHIAGLPGERGRLVLTGREVDRVADAGGTTVVVEPGTTVTDVAHQRLQARGLDLTRRVPEEV